MSKDAGPATRMTLMAKRAQIKLASDGVTLLEGKREALLTELIDRAKQLRALRNDLHERGRETVSPPRSVKTKTPEVLPSSSAPKESGMASLIT